MAWNGNARGVLKITHHTITPLKTAHFYQMRKQLPGGKQLIIIEYVRYVSNTVITGEIANQTPPTAPSVEPPIISIWDVAPMKTSQPTEEIDNQAQDAKTASWKIFSGCQRTAEHARLKSNSISQGQKSKVWRSQMTRQVFPYCTHQSPLDQALKKKTSFLPPSPPKPYKVLENLNLLHS